MALYHFSVSQIKRSAGQSVLAAAAYRAGERLYSEYYDEISDYTRKGGVLHTEILLPAHAPECFRDRATLWNAVEATERHPKAQLAYSFDIALQNELSLNENIELARAFVQKEFVDRGMIADLAIHSPDKTGGIPNPHMHVMATMRPLNPDGSFAETPSSKDSYETTDMNEKIEKADYKLGEDGNVIEFLHLNKDKNIRVEYMGDRTYKTTMSPTDRLAAANVYELAQILSAMEQIKKEQEEANLKIGFINKKKERKAQEEITD